MGNQIRDAWPKFDALIEQAESADTKALIAAMKLQSELLNSRLFQIEQNTAYAMKKDGHSPMYSAMPQS